MSSTIATEKLYYIMDYSGNHYRVDSDDQLVVSDTIDATVFSFAEANRKIGSGTKSRYYFMTPINDDNIDDMVEIEEEEDSDYVDAIVYSVKDITAGEIMETVEKNISEYDLSKIDWEEYLTLFTFIVSGIKEYRESLIRAQSDVDQKICDVLHYIELCATNDEEAADLVELLRVCRENRREIKDELFRVETFQKNIGTSANVAKAKSAISSIKGLENRKYKPRIFAELFEGRVLKGRGALSHRENLLFTYETNANVEQTAQEGNESMNLERRETAFDGKNNDWMAFAIQEEEFYKNAAQYISNLRLDIETIDNNISDLVDEIENTNCNVTQGYKMYKCLKELRLERKEKVKELECLYILTDQFNLEAMVEVCENSVKTMAQYLNRDTGTEEDNMPQYA